MVMEDVDDDLSDSPMADEDDDTTVAANEENIDKEVA
jgi:hypothetical protein